MKYSIHNTVGVGGYRCDEQGLLTVDLCAIKRHTGEQLWRTLCTGRDAGC